jgi:small subunit ribosomal protein S19e
MRIHLAPPEALIHKVSEQLKSLEEVQPPVWAAYAKTGVHKERPPMQDDWWYIRSASVLRKVSLRGPIGTNKLRVLYGGRKNRGHKPDVNRRGSGSVIRTVLQQLEAAGLIQQVERNGHKGRVVTAKGQSLLDKAANEVIA